MDIALASGDIVVALWPIDDSAPAEWSSIS